MKRGLMVALVACLSVGSLAAAAAPPAKPYQPPRNWLGQPDLEGFWTNATLTPTTRESKFGTRPTYTPEEVKQIEGNQLAGLEQGNEPTDPNAGAPPLNGIV